MSKNTKLPRVYCVQRSCTSVFREGAMVPRLPSRVTLHKKFTRVRFMRFLLLIRLSNHPDFVEIIPILLENPESRPIFRWDRKNPDLTSNLTSRKTNVFMPKHVLFLNAHLVCIEFSSQQRANLGCLKTMAFCKSCCLNSGQVYSLQAYK